MTARPVSSLIVGDPADPHVAAVTDRLPPTGCVVVNAATVGDIVRRVDLAGAALVDLAGRACRTDAPGARPTGWIRRLAPAGWDDDVLLGSHRAAVLASRLGLLSAVVRDPALQWITPVDAAFAAEGKTAQYRAAARIGAIVPDTVIATAHDALSGLKEPFVVKPLGPGGFRNDQGEQQVVYARTTTRAELADLDLAAAPFMAQNLVHAAHHLRIVTVGNRAWTAALDAAGRPCDWRQDPSSHDGFRHSPESRHVEEQAVAVACELRCGYTSQDWIITTDGAAVFLDLNPAGQWLFLPEPIASQAADAIANMLLAPAGA